MSFWRKEDPVLDESGPVPVVLQGGMWDYQREWWDLPNFIRLMVGGFGSGKTRQLGKWGIATALHNAPVWTALVSPTFGMAKKTLVPTLEELLEGKSTVRSDLHWRHNKGEHQFEVTIEGRPTATIVYLSGDNPDSLKGPNLGTVGIDEPFIQDKKVFEIMVSRCRDPRARLHAMGLTGTPEELNWGYELAEGDLKDKYDVGIVAGIDTARNRALPKDYAPRLVSGYDKLVADAYVRGQFVSLSTGKVFHAFDRRLNVARYSDEASQGGVHFWGTDFNVDPMAFVVGWRQGEHVHIYAEYELPNSDTQYACGVIRDEHPRVRMCYPDPTGKRRNTAAPAGMSDFKWIRESGFILLAPNDPWPLRDSYNSVNARFSKGLLTIDPDCKKLIRYLSEHSHEKKREQESMTHLLDALRYPVTHMFPAWRGASARAAMVGA